MIVLKNRNMKSQLLILGLFVGFTTGLLIGIIFAPEKGAKMRRKFFKKSGDYSKVFLDKMEDFHESIPEKFKISKKRVEEAVSKATEK